MKHAIVFFVLSLPLLGQRFDFSSGKGEVYSAERGSGFEEGAVLKAGAGSITAERPPFYFSVRVPAEGNYRVTVTLGDRESATVTTVKAELRRLMLEKVETKAGEFVKRTFLVNTRTPAIPGGGSVKLKDREKTSEIWAWDDRITLEFTDAHPAVAAIEIAPAPEVPTLFIAGDSTSTDQGSEPFNSWGQMLPRFLKPEIAVANHGESGESLRGFVGERRLEKLLSVMRAGDFLVIQMGHNDQKEKGEGVGAFTTYKASLKRFIAEARSKGATPILVTPMNRKSLDAEGHVTNTLGDYPDAVRQTAAEEKVALIDLNEMSKRLYEAIGPKDIAKAFADGDATHHNNYGSYELARCIVQSVREQSLGLAKYIASDVGAFDPSHPDPLATFAIPAEPRGTVQKPYGN
jgi:lysophospholipase L1-like esterase